ncbi:uncharacterized protein LOC123520899 [Echinops telfairi]|uniref:Uncharacterized protein LOC123520899 n=1 Tax=Echinops telfairi TaxID=9371 RepID=A0AC55CKA6_ECHTE|nr:uncharacterized protein LOC123520899 [Echinops telfairi]
MCSRPAHREASSELTAAASVSTDWSKQDKILGYAGLFSLDQDMDPPSCEDFGSWDCECWDRSQVSRLILEWGVWPAHAQVTQMPSQKHRDPGSFFGLGVLGGEPCSQRPWSLRSCGAEFLMDQQEWAGLLLAGEHGVLAPARTAVSVGHHLALFPWTIMQRERTLQPTLGHHHHPDATGSPSEPPGAHPAEPDPGDGQIPCWTASSFQRICHCHLLRQRFLRAVTATHYR